jgi:phenylacetate-CoA ligase
MGDVAAAEGIDLSKSNVRLIMVAGEPGGSLPATRARIDQLWPGARVFDHHGMTEVGPVTYECPAHPCRLHVIDSAYLAEVIDPGTLAPVRLGEEGELILTTLKRTGSPLIRYRTGDLVRQSPHHAESRPCECGRFETALEGGIIGRTDDMVVVRGVNVYPSAIEQILRQFSEIAEYQVRVQNRGAMTELLISIEAASTAESPAALVTSVEKALQTSLNLRIPVQSVAANSLPRSELKARRWVTC